MNFGTVSSSKEAYLEKDKMEEELSRCNEKDRKDRMESIQFKKHQRDILRDNVIVSRVRLEQSPCHECFPTIFVLRSYWLAQIPEGAGVVQIEYVG